MSLDATDRAKPRAAAKAMLIAICVASALAGRLVYLALPFEGDGAMFAYMGKLAAEGGRFGEELIDNKFPTVGLVTSMFWRTFGTWWAGYVIAQTVMALAAAWMLSRAAARSFGEHARLATFLTAVVLLNLNAAVMGGFQLETILSFFSIVAAACALVALGAPESDWRDAFACGLGAGCAILVKPTGGAVLVAFILALLIKRRSLNALLATMLGAVIPILGAVVYLHVSDQLRLMPQIAQQIGEYASGSSFDPWDLYRPLSLMLLFGAALLIRGWVYRRPAHRAESSAMPHVWVFAIGWLALEFAGVLMQRRMYAYHFLPLAAPAALVFGALPRRATVGQLAGVLAIPILFNIWGIADTWKIAQTQRPAWPAVTAWLGQHCSPGERVWRDQTMYVLLHSNLRPASRVQLTFLFMNSDEAPQRFSAMLLDDLSRTQPSFVVMPRDVEAHIHTQTTGVVELSRIPTRRESFASAWRNIDQYVKNRYVLVETIADEAIWQSK